MCGERLLVHRDFARLLVREIFFRVQDLCAAAGRTAEQFIYAACAAPSARRFDEAHAVAITEDESLREERREERADLSAVFVETFVLRTRHVVERTVRPRIALFEPALHVHRVAFDDGEERLLAVEVVGARKQ